MAQISITIPDAQLTRVLDSIAVKFNYSELKLENETKAQFARRMLVQSVKQWVKDGELKALADAANQARVDKELDVDTNVGIS